MKPVLLHYYLTNRCNARCAFCTIWRDQPKKDAAFEDVIRNLKDARRAGCRFVDFTGGEPLLHARLPEFLREARRLGYVTSVTTNCILFPDLAPELTGLVDLLHFSFDGGTAEVHDRLRGVASFDMVLRSIDIARAHELYPDLLFTYTKDNIDSFPAAYKIARKKKLLILLDPVFTINEPDVIDTVTHKKAIAYAQKPGVYLNRAHLSLRGLGGNHIGSPRCKAVTSTIVILPDNKLALPCFHHSADSLAVTENLSETLKSGYRVEAERMQGAYGFCEGCHINCYFDPSYNYRFDLLFLQSLLSKFRYFLHKYIVYRRPLPRSGWIATLELVSNCSLNLLRQIKTYIKLNSHRR